MSIAIPVLLAVAIATVFTFGMVLLARATRARHRMRGTDDVETAYITAASTLYGIFIAFMIFTVWTRYNEAMEAIDIEASTVAEIYQMADGLPQPVSSRLQNLMLDYGHSVVDDEWKRMVNGESSPRTEAVVRKVWRLFNEMPSAGVTDTVLRDHLLTSWTELSEQRRIRLLRSSTGLTEYAYALLVVGGLITLGLACVFTVDDFRTHMLKASALAAIIALMTVAIWGLDHPFRSRVRLEPRPFVRMMDMLESRR